MNDVTAIRTEMQTLASLIAATRTILGDGRAVDLTGFDQRVVMLCQSLQSIDNTDAKALKPGLIALIDDIEQLKRDLLAQHDALGIELRRLGVGHSAANAYTRTPGR